MIPSPVDQPTIDRTAPAAQEASARVAPWPLPLPTPDRARNASSFVQRHDGGPPFADGGEMIRGASAFAHILVRVQAGPPTDLSMLGRTLMRSPRPRSVVRWGRIM